MPRERLEAANQLSLFTTYGSAPVAAALFAGLALLTGMLDNFGRASAGQPGRPRAVRQRRYLPGLRAHRSAAAAIPRPPAAPARARSTPGVWRTIVEGWTFVGTTPLVRGLVVGMLGAFAAGGA